MSDVELIFLLLTIFYLGEAAFWLRPGMFVVISQLGERHRLRSPSRGAPLRNIRGGLVPGHLLPLGSSLGCEQWPVSISPDGIHAGVTQAIGPESHPDQSGRWLPWGDIKAVAIDRNRVIINGSPFLQVGAIPFADYLAGLLLQLAGSPPGKRLEILDRALDRSLDTDEIRRRFGQVRETTSLLKVTCTVLFVYVLVHGPFLALVVRPSTLWPLLVGYLGLLIAAMVHYHHVHGLLRPADRAERWKHLGLMLVSPADAIHSRDSLFRELLASFHPLAVTAALCQRPVFEELAAQVWRDLHHPLPADPATLPAARTAQEWFHTRLMEAIGRFLERQGINPAHFLLPPAAEDATCRTYCPRCQGQYVLGQGQCSSCRLSLKSLPDRASGEG